MEQTRIKHDLDLYKMALATMKLPFNKNRTDKTFVLNAIFYFNDHFSRLKKR